MTWAVMEVANGHALYADWRIWPHRFYPYGPLFTMPLGWILGLFGHTQFDCAPYLLGRLQSVVSIFGSSFLIALILKRLKFSWNTAILVAVAVPVSFPDLVLALTSFRPDFPALFWCMFAAIVGFSRPNNPRYLTGSLFLYCLSLGYKPTLLAFPVAFVLTLLIFVSFRKGLLWAAALALICIVSVAALNFITDGRFLLNIVTGSQMGFTMENLRLIWTLLWAKNDPWLAVCLWSIYLKFALAAAISVRSIYLRSSIWKTGIGLYYIVSLFLAHLGMLKVGAALHYVLEPYYLSWIVFGTALCPDSLNLPIRKPTKTLILATGMLLFVIPGLIMTVRVSKTAYTSLTSLAEPTPFDSLTTLPGDVWLGDLAFIHPAISTHAIADPLWYASMTKSGELDREPLISRISQQQFSRIILSPGCQYVYFSTPAPWIGNTIRQHYVLVEEIPAYQTWLPLDKNTTGAISSPQE